MLKRPPVLSILTVARSSRFPNTKRNWYNVAMSTSAINHANEFVDFLNASPTPFHAVKNGAALLEKAGFKLIKVSIYQISQAQCADPLKLCRNETPGRQPLSLERNTISQETGPL